MLDSHEAASSNDLQRLKTKDANRLHPKHMTFTDESQDIADTLPCLALGTDSTASCSERPRIVCNSMSLSTTSL